MKRRLFVKSLGGAAGSLLINPATPTPTFSTMDSFKKAVNGKAIDNSYWKLLRKQFLLPPDYAYLNTGGLGSSPFIVTERVKEMMDYENTYPTPGHSSRHWDRIKTKFATFLGPGTKKEEIAFTSTGTEGINLIINGLPLKKGDEVITSSHEHVALSIPLIHRMKRDGIVFRTFNPDMQKGINNVNQIEHLITKKTRLIFVSHVTCTTGQVMPVKEIGQLAKSRGIWFALDGAQAIGQIPVNLQEIGADFYAASGHKWLLGPKRTGILYVREELLDLVEPTTIGAYSNGDFNFEQRTLKLHPTAQRYEYGTHNDALIYGLESAVDFISTIGIKTIQQHNKQLSESFYKKLEKTNIPNLRILSPTEEKYRSSMITFKLEGKNNIKICRSITNQKFRVRYVPEANLNAIRASFHVYNNMEEVNGLVGKIEVRSAKFEVRS
ncbi:MAG: aminotransferase class V-fold PLP-dependent enzyme [bacterium]|nr:aminotransferase class V-fold PLP-dependent enzyme [bacterium]